MPSPGGGGQELCSFDINISVTCTGVLAHFSANPNWPTHAWDFGDGSPILTGGTELQDVYHYYANINPYLGDLDLTGVKIVAKHGLDPDQLICEQIVPLPGILVGTGCGSNNTVQQLINDQILPSTQLNNRPLYVFGDLEVNASYIFNGCSIKIIPGGKINVNSASLTLNGFTVLDAVGGNCPGLWNGIEVQSNSTLSTNLATIRNAYYALRPIHTPGGLLYPRLNLYNATFEQNFIGICAINGPFAIGAFSGNAFLGAGDSQIPQISTCNTPAPIGGIPFVRRTYCGIYCNGYQGGALSLPSSAVSNVFKDLQAGIVCLNAGATVAGCRFENILPISDNAAQYQGTAITFNDQFGNRKLDVTGLGKTGVATVSNCVRGIHAHAFQDYTQATVKNCRMEQIQNGVLLSEAPSGNFSTATIQDNYFDCTKYFYTPAQVTSTGIEIQDPNPGRSDLTIQSNEIEVEQPDAFFINPIILPLNTAIYPTGIRVTAMLPQIGASIKAMSLKIKHNDIKLIKGYKGISVENVANAEISDNNIDNTYHQLFYEPFHQYLEIDGIEILGGMSNRANCNSITSVTLTDDINGVAGIIANSTIGFHFDANTLTDLQACFFVLNDNGTDCNLESNQIKNFSNPISHGLTYHDALTGPQRLRGNVWTGTFLTGAYYRKGPIGFNYCDSKYFVSPTANIAGNSPNIVVIQGQMEPCGDWFEVLEEGEYSHTCGQTWPGPTGNGLARNETDRRLAAGGTDALNAGFKWSAQMGLYRKFTERPDLVGNDPDIANFIAAQVNQPLARTYAVRNGLLALHADSSFATQMSDFLLQINEIREDMSERQALLENNAAAWSEWSALNGQLETLEKEAGDMLVQHTAEAAASAEALQSDNNAVICTGESCENERFLHDLFLETRIVAPRVPTAGEQGQIKSIGETCPGEGGPAVFVARAWYYLLTGEALTDSCSRPLPELPPEERAMNVKPLIPGLLTIFPNPADQSFSIAVPALEADGVLSVCNAWGNVIRRVELPKNSRQNMRLPASDLPAGLYAVTWTSSSKNAASVAKLLIVH